MTLTREDRFWSKVDRSGPEGCCWLWTGAKGSGGYGRFRMSSAPSRFATAHRYSYVLAHGSLRDDICVLHQCDTPACVNPAHLFLGTRAENMADMVRKGRSQHKGRCGAANPMHKLKQSDVDAIRAAKAAGQQQWVIAEMFHIDRSTVSYIVRGKRWAHV